MLHAGWEPIYNNPNTWHFRFNGEYPEKLVKERERTYFEYFWNVRASDKTHSIPEADRKAYTAAYSRPERMHAGWAYFVSWPQLAKNFAQLSQTKLTMPVLSIGGDKSLGNELAEQMKLVCERCHSGCLKRHRTLDFRRTAKGNVRCAAEFL